MVDPDNLRTASLYINNQLLSRGLLRDGNNINFADPESGDGGVQGTMGKVMSVINDLILRRDRDAESRESLSTTLRTLRADSQRQTTEILRQSEKLSDAQRKLDSAEATERALRTQLKIADQNIHRLKDDAVKMKTIVAQARAACANEVRKRDRQIDSLKKAVTDASRVRGGGKSRDVLCITVIGEVGGDERGVPAGATQAEGYSLRLESNEFLTELARGLSEENEGLLALVRRVVDRLREMSGLERGSENLNGTGFDHHSDNINAELVQVAPQKTADELASELEEIMEHLRTILTNPSFVPIEEVEIREETIGRLRAGLETMESRWKDAVHMIDGWRKRMVSSGKSVDVEDLQMSLRLSPVRVRDVAETADVVPMRLSCVQEEDEEEEEEEEDRNEEEEYEEEEENVEAQEEVQEDSRRTRSPSPVESLNLIPAPGYQPAENEENDSASDSSSIFQDDIDIDELDAEEPNVQVLQESTYANSMDSPPLPIPPQLSPLKDSYSAGNKGFSERDFAYRKHADFTTIIEENTWDLAEEEEEEEEQGPPPPPHIVKPQSPRSPHQHQQKKSVSYKNSPPWQEPPRQSSTASYESPLFGKSGERPSQSDPSRKLFSKPTPNLGKQLYTKSQPEPGSANSQASTKSSKRPTSSPDPSAAEMKRTNSDPTNPPSRQQTSSKSIRQVPATTQPQTISSSSSASSLRSAANVTERQQQPTVSRPRSPVRNNQANNTTTNSRLPRPNSANPAPQQSPLTMATIAAKLAASEREADAARVRAKLRAVRSGGQRRNPALRAPATTSAPGSPPRETKSNKAEPKQEENDLASVDPVKRDKEPPQPRSRGGTPARKSNPTAETNEVDELAGSVRTREKEQNNEGSPSKQNGGSPLKLVKRRRDRNDRHTSKAASRRRSTLSPWELDALIQGPGAGVDCS
ncbi:Afadin and alpha-actinin-binding-domain-containing protein [Daldinia eschscholtzii]|nr:Afadin and alpha-actinin-binding-domain-containing protein [Daldinia eschscholtzii]